MVLFSVSPRLCNTNAQLLGGARRKRFQHGDRRGLTAQRSRNQNEAFTAAQEKFETRANILPVSSTAQPYGPNQKQDDNTEAAAVTEATEKRPPS